MYQLIAELTKRPSQYDCLKQPIILELENLNYTPFHLIALILFALAVVHTLAAGKIHEWTRNLEIKETPKMHGGKRVRHPGIQFLYFLAEVEIVFAFWAIPLFAAMVFFFGWTVAFDYVDTRIYTEPLFVAVILAMASTRPIVHAAELMIRWFAKGLGASLSAWWFTLLTVGPLLGSLITEAGAMALCALLLSHQFYQFHPSTKLSYATLGLLFVNISVGGILTDFASPAVLILAHCWKWSALDMFTQFGWKAAIGILISNLVYWVYFRKELKELNVRKRALAVFASYTTQKKELSIPKWVTLVHMVFMAWIVAVAHYPAMFIAAFLFFIAFHQATRHHQSPIHLARPLLVGLFLAGLVIHGGLQGWWVVQLLEGLKPLAVMGVSILLTGFNDNTAIAYLATLIPDWGEAFKYALFTGVIAGGGLTVIANAPNPAGYGILKKHFHERIRPIKLFLSASIPTLILYLIFYFFGPVF